MKERKVRFSKKAKEEMRLAYRRYVADDAESAAEGLIREVERAAGKIRL